MEKKWYQTFGEGITGKKGRWVVLLAWLLLAAVLNMTLPQANSQKNELALNLESSLPSQQAKDMVNKEFSSDSGTPALLTWYRATGITDKDLTLIQQFTKEVSEHPVKYDQFIVPFYRLPLPALKADLSKDGTTLVLPVIFQKKLETAQLEEGINELISKAKVIFSYDPSKIKIDNKDQMLLRVTGPAGIAVDATALFSKGDLSLLLGTVSIVLILLLLIYRSPILALIPLIGVGVAYGVISPILGGLGKAGWVDFDSQSTSIMTVLLFGAGTDYCLFLISKFRTLLEVEKDKLLAMKTALRSTSGAIAMSGLTVVFSLLALLLAKYGSIHRFAIPFSLSIFIMMGVSLTLIPALLSILGRGSFYPFVPRTHEMKEERARNKGKTLAAEKLKEGFGLRLGGLITRKPWPILLLTLVFLGVFAVFAGKITYTYDTLSSFPKDMPSREGFQLIADRFNPGELAPVQVIIQTDGTETDIQDALKGLSYVANVTDGKQGENDPNIISYNVELKANPYSNEAMKHIPNIRKTAETALQQSGVAHSSAKVWVGGPTAEQYDTKSTTKSDSSVIIPVVLAMIAILLLVYLHSITATAYLIGTVLLSYFSALGLGWVILHYFFGVEAIQGFIPLYAFVFIVALGEDYNIFMISSIWKKSKTMPLSQAIKEGVGQSGGVITSAGLILAGTFAVLTTMPIQILVHFGTITAIGVLLDTFIVRPLLVPAITTVLGRRAFWPSKHLESAAPKTAIGSE